jgi:hypothetical protein
MPIVKASLGTIETPNNPNDYVTHGTIDLSMLLSEYYGKNIRQGHNFKVNGLQIALVPHDPGTTTDFDTGGSIISNFNYVPTTKHSRRAWNDAFTMWKRQRRFQTTGGVGTMNDDFECGYEIAQAGTRTSTLLTASNDSASEKVVLLGDSSSNSDWSLQDYYNSKYTTRPPSRNHFSNVEYKENKFSDTRYPSGQSIWVDASTSSVVTKFDDIGTNTSYSGGFTDSEWTEFPQSCNVMCGLLRYFIYMHPGDTAAQIEDNLEVYLNISVTSWKPLAYPRSKPKKKKSRRRTSGKGTRYSRKRGRR